MGSRSVGWSGPLAELRVGVRVELVGRGYRPRSVAAQLG